MTPAISVWANSSAEKIMRERGQALSRETGLSRMPGSSLRLPPPPNSGTPEFGWGREQNAARSGSSRSRSGVLDHDGRFLPVLAGRGVLQDQHRRRPIVEEHALGAREGHRRGGPALEAAGLERPDQRLGVGALRWIECLGDDEHVAEAVERGIDRRLLVFFLIRLGEGGAFL